MKSKLFNITLFALLLSSSLQAQQFNLPLNHLHLNRYNSYLDNIDTAFHTSVKPYILQEIKSLPGYDSANSALLYKGDKRWLKRIMNDTFWLINKNKIKASLDIPFNVTAGNQLLETTTGFSLSAQAGKNLALYGDLIYSETRFPDYLDSIIHASKVVPGQGEAIFKGSKINYYNYSGYASYKAGRYFNFQLGMGKNFIGDGYRSLFLSDNAYNYPYLKVTTTVWKLKYVNLFTNFKDIRYDANPRNKAYNKYSAIHYLSWNISKRINIGLFESIIFETRDTTGRFNYDINYLNPVIFYRPVEYSIGSADNALMGFTTKIKPIKNHVLYTQFLLDEFLLKEIKADIKKTLNPADSTKQWGWWANKYGIQVGYKYYNVFGVKNLHFQTEYNYIRPWTYSHGSIYQNYGHYNQPLAHPLGANLSESVSFLRYYFKNFYAEAKFLYAEYGEDASDVFYGRDIYVSYTNRGAEYGNYTGQGVRTNLIYKEVKAGVLLNAKTNLCIEAGFNNRNFKNTYRETNNNFYFIGIKTALSNFYYDI